MKRKHLAWLQDGDTYMLSHMRGDTVSVGGSPGCTVDELLDMTDAQLATRKLTPATRGAIRARKAAAKAQPQDEITRIATGISPKLGELVGAMLQPAEQPVAPAEPAQTPGEQIKAALRGKFGRVGQAEMRAALTAVADTPLAPCSDTIAGPTTYGKCHNAGVQAAQERALAALRGEA